MIALSCLQPYSFSKTWLTIPPRCVGVILLVWKLRNETESDQVCEDLSGRYGFKRTLEIYRLCTEEQYSFLMYDALRDTFFKRFELEVKVRVH